MVDRAEIQKHLQGLEMELGYLNENLGNYNRVQRKNVLEYLNIRIIELEEYSNQIQNVQSILNVPELNRIEDDGG